MRLRAARLSIKLHNTVRILLKCLLLCVGMEREQDKVKREIKAAAKKGDPKVIRNMAKNYAMAKRAVERMHVTKAHVNSIVMQLQTNAGTCNHLLDATLLFSRCYRMLMACWLAVVDRLAVIDLAPSPSLLCLRAAMVKVAGTMAKSTAIMKSMHEIMRVPEMMSTARKMQEEMSKAGIIEEMMEDSMAASEPAGLDEEADEITEGVMWELTGGLLGTAPSAPIGGMASTAVRSGAGAVSAPGRVAVGMEDGSAAGGAGTSGPELDELRDRLGKI